MEINDRGLPAVPRGLSRSLTSYLQSLNSLILRLSGKIRGSGDSRALRVSESIVSTEKIEDSAITTTKIADAAVTSSKMANGSIVSSKIAEGAVTESKISDNAVTTDKIKKAAVTSEKIAVNAIVTSKINNGAVTKDKIQDKSVTIEKISDDLFDSFLASITDYYSVNPLMLLDTEAGDAEDGQIITLTGEWYAQPSIGISEIEIGSNADGKLGVTDLTEIEDGVWQFTAKGNFSWVAVGFKKDSEV